MDISSNPPNPFTATYVTLGKLRETLEAMEMEHRSIEVIWAKKLAAELADHLAAAERNSKTTP